MLGRGAVADPLLSRRIRDGGDEQATEADWEELKAMIAEFWTGVQAKLTPLQSPGRLKQWLGMMQRSYPQAERLFRAVREAKRATELSAILAREGIVTKLRAEA
jgi:tRNA-dihydrouridine synthase C